MPRAGTGPRPGGRETLLYSVMMLSVVYNKMHSANSRLARGADKCTANTCLRDPTDPTVRRPSCEANGCLPGILKSPKVHCCVPSVETVPCPQPDKPTPHHLSKIHFKIIFTISKPEDHSSTVVKVFCYKSEGRWFDSRWCHWNFSLT